MKKLIFQYSILVLFSAVLWLLPGCKKDNDPGSSVIQGRLTEYGTQTPVKDAKIYLSCDESQFGGPLITKLFDSLSTDADGRFYKEYPAGEFCANVVIQPYKKGYFVPTPLDYVTVPKQYDFVMDPEAWLKVATVPDVIGDLIYFTGTFTGAAGWETSKKDGSKEWYFLARGNREHWIDWDYWGGGVNSHKETISLIAHDTTTYTIRY